MKTKYYYVVTDGYTAFGVFSSLRKANKFIKNENNSYAEPTDCLHTKRFTLDYADTHMCNKDCSWTSCKFKRIKY